MLKKLSRDGVDYWFNFHNFTSSVSEGDGDGWRCYVMETWMEIRQNLIRVLPLPLNGHTLPTWHRWQATSINTFQKIFCIFNTVDKHMLCFAQWNAMVSESPNRLSEDWGGRLFGQTYLNQDFPGGASHEMYIHYICIFICPAIYLIHCLISRKIWDTSRGADAGKGAAKALGGVQCQSIWSVLQSLNGGFNTQVLMLVLVVKT